MLIQCKCQLCSKEFLASSSRISRGSAKHCSRECANQNRPPILSKEIKLNCHVCNKEFFVKPSRLEKTNVRFCSKKCRGIQQTLDDTEERRCGICNKSFRISKYNINEGGGKFCSDECRLQKPKTGINKKCEYNKCNNVFYTEPSQIKVRKFCSKECLSLFALDNRVKRNCKYCEREFSIKSCQIIQGTGFYCSQECKYKGRLTGKYLHCPTCGSEFYANNTKITRNKQCFCSRECSREWYSGPNSPFWRGGVTPLQKQIRDSKEYKEWRTSIFERDNYTCQICQHRSGNGKTIHLEAHHIQSFVDYPELIFDLDNGQTLCRKCHETTDSWGQKPKNKELTLEILQKILDDMEKYRK